MKDPRFIIGTILILALAAFGFTERQKIEELTRQIAQLQDEAALQAARAKEDAAKLQQQIDDRKAVITQMEEQRKNVAATEPAETAAVIGLGLAGFAAWRRHSRKVANGAVPAV